MNPRESQPDIDFRTWVTDRIIPGTVYELLDEAIGAGGYGRIYKVRHIETGRVCALKALNRELIIRNDIAQRLRQEVQGDREAAAAPELGRRLRRRPHPRQPLLLRHGAARGQSLRKLLGSNRQGLAADDACWMMRQVLSALVKAHAHGIIHRDVKPDNIFIARDRQANADTVKLIDFGVAKVFGSKTVHTAPGSNLGTMHYFAPENIQGAPPTPQTDIYAVGVTFWEALAGAHPFPHHSQLATLSAIVKEGVPSLDAFADVAERVPAPVREIVRRATAADPKLRFASALEFIEALDRATGPSSRAGAPRPPSFAPPPPLVDRTSAPRSTRARRRCRTTRCRRSTC